MPAGIMNVSNDHEYIPLALVRQPFEDLPACLAQGKPERTSISYCCNAKCMKEQGITYIHHARVINVDPEGEFLLMSKSC